MPAVDRDKQDEQAGKLAEYVAARLTDARNKVGLSQAALAEAAGVSLRQYQYLESGRCTPNLDTLCRLAVALGMGPSSFVPNKSWTRASYR